MATQIIYNGTVIGTVDAGQSKVLKCNGKKMKSDVEIRAGERTEIKYDGAVIATVEAGSSKTIKCAGKTMKSNIEIRVEDDTPGKEGVSPTVEMIDIDGGTRIIITDVNGPKSADIMDGKDGEDGSDGERGTGILNITGGLAAYTTAVNGLTPSYRILLTRVISDSKVSKVIVGDTIRYSTFLYPIIYVDATYAYCSARITLQGTAGAAGKDGTDATVTSENIKAALGYTPANEETVEQISEDVADLKENSGMNSTSAALLIAILRSGVYDADQSANIDALETALNAGVLPDVPDVETIPLAVVHGTAARSDGVKMTYDPSQTTRGATNPLAFYVEDGKTYTISLASYDKYGFYPQGLSYSTSGTNFAVVEGTDKTFKGDFTRTLAPGWQYADYTFTPDGTYQVIALQFRNLGNTELTADDIAALNSMLTVTVE